MSDKILLISLYVITLISSGVGIGYFFKSIKLEFKVLQLQIENLSQRIASLEEKFNTIVELRVKQK